MQQKGISALRRAATQAETVDPGLEGLVSTLDETPQEWKDSFIEQWSVLEIAYAVALDRQQLIPTAGDHDIAAALDALELLIAERTGNRA